jgi:hypothetical protein
MPIKSTKATAGQSGPRRQNSRILRRQTTLTRTTPGANLRTKRRVHSTVNDADTDTNERDPALTSQILGDLKLFLQKTKIVLVLLNLVMMY